MGQLLALTRGLTHASAYVRDLTSLVSQKDDKTHNKQGRGNTQCKEKKIERKVERKPKLPM